MSDRRLASPAFHALPDDDVDDVRLFLLQRVVVFVWFSVAGLLFVAEV